jgi:hypothetical protein
MALVAMTVSDTTDYVSDMDAAKSKQQVPIDPDDHSKGTTEQIVIGEGATVFTLKPLDVFLMSWIYDNASDISGKQGSSEVGIRTKVNETNIQAVRHGLAGLKNFHDSKGSPIIFRTVKVFVGGKQYTVADDSVLQALGLKLVTELAEQIKRRSDVGAGEEKN